MIRICQNDPAATVSTNCQAQGARQDASRQAPAPAPPTLSTSRLFGASPVVFIEHAGQRYTLRITRENKLILTK